MVGFISILPSQRDKINDQFNLNDKNSSVLVAIFTGKDSNSNIMIFEEA